MTRADVIREAMTWMGTPYHHHGRIKCVGVDCVQILCAVYQACGVWPAEAEPGEYASDWHLSRCEQKYLEQLAPWADPTDTPKPGDIAVFAFGRVYSHGAIVVGEGVLLHSYYRPRSVNRGGVILSRIDEEPLSGVPVVYFDPWKGKA